jgi:hypothetical protein
VQVYGLSAHHHNGISLAAKGVNRVQQHGPGTASTVEREAPTGVEDRLSQVARGPGGPEPVPGQSQSTCPSALIVPTQARAQSVPGVEDADGSVGEVPRVARAKAEVVLTADGRNLSISHVDRLAQSLTRSDYFGVVVR